MKAYVIDELRLNIANFENVSSKLSAGNKVKASNHFTSTTVAFLGERNPVVEKWVNNETQMGPSEARNKIKFP